LFSPKIYQQIKINFQGKGGKMKHLIVIAMVIGSIFVNEVVDLGAALLSNQIEIRKTLEIGESKTERFRFRFSVKHGPKFGDGWSEEQKEVWNKTQEWWQFRLASDWKKLENLYHKDAILYHYFHKVPFNPPAYKELAKGATFDFVCCTVHEIRIIENIGIVMLYYEIMEPIRPKRMIFVWMKQGADWKLIADMNKEE
jgi:hypothetical protein